MPNTFVKIQTLTIATPTSTMDFTNIPQTYTDLKLVMSARSTRATYADDDVYVNINGLTTNQSTKYVQGSGNSGVGSFTSSRWGLLIPADGAATANVFGDAELYIVNYANTANYKSSIFDGFQETNHSTTAYQRMHINIWSSTAAINQLTLVTQGGNFTAYSTATLYGIKSS